jgi:lambda repressor-like predicted transcriptional regulator
MAFKRAFIPNDKELEYILQQHKNGKSVHALSNEFNVSFKTMKLTLLETGQLKLSKNLKSIQGDIVNDIVKHYEDNPGITLEELSEKFKLTYHIVRELLRDHYQRPLPNPRVLRKNARKNNNT